MPTVPKLIEGSARNSQDIFYYPQCQCHTLSSLVWQFLSKLYGWLAFLLDRIFHQNRSKTEAVWKVLVGFRRNFEQFISCLFCRHVPFFRHLSVTESDMWQTEHGWGLISQECLWTLSVAASVVHILKTTGDTFMIMENKKSTQIFLYFREKTFFRRVEAFPHITIVMCCIDPCSLANAIYVGSSQQS